MSQLERKAGRAPINGAQIYYEAAGEGQPFIMLHAGVADHRQWNNEFAHFAERYRVVRYDMRGYGQSEPVAGKFSHLEDLVALLDYLELAPPFILMGCSMGGGLAIDFALTRPSQVSALILVGAGPTGLELDVETPEAFADAEQAFKAGDLKRVAEIETQIWFESASFCLMLVADSFDSSQMDVNVYLQRIGYRGMHRPTRETLRRLHRAHLFTVPFENLDIHLDHPIHLSRPAFYDKIVRRRRGGFCYELNGLFGWLLGQLGFEVTLLSARVFSGGQWGPEFDHLVLLVGGERRLIADVGFGDSFLVPLRLEHGTVQEQNGAAYRLYRASEEWVLQRRDESAWEPQYAFSLIPRQLDEFRPMCHYQQTSPESHFTQKSVCSLARANGRVTLSNDRLIVTEGEARQEKKIAGEEQHRTLLQTHFGIRLPANARLERLLAPRP